MKPLRILEKGLRGPRMIGTEGRRVSPQYCGADLDPWSGSSHGGGGDGAGTACFAALDSVKLCTDLCRTPK